MTDHEALEALSKKATQGVWRYRPDEYDDWGIVKSPVLPNGFACVLAQFRDPDALDNETLARHREAKTDPWEANARFIVALVNLYRTGQLIPAPSVETVGEASGGGSGAVVGEAMSKTLHNALLASYDSVVPPMPSVDNAMVEQLPKEAAMLREIAQSYSRGIEWQANLSASAAVIDAATARITALEASLAEAEGRVIAEVVAWLRNEAGDPDDFATYAATALENGEWKK